MWSPDRLLASWFWRSANLPRFARQIGCWRTWRGASGQGGAQRSAAPPGTPGAPSPTIHSYTHLARRAPPLASPAPPRRRTHRAGRRRWARACPPRLGPGQRMRRQLCCPNLPGKRYGQPARASGAGGVHPRPWLARALLLALSMTTGSVCLPENYSLTHSGIRTPGRYGVSRWFRGVGHGARIAGPPAKGGSF